MSDEAVIYQTRWRRRQLDEGTLVAVVARLAQGDTLAHCATDLQVSYGTLRQTLVACAWRAWVTQLGHPDVARPDTG